MSNEELPPSFEPGTGRRLPGSPNPAERSRPAGEQRPAASPAPRRVSAQGRSTQGRGPATSTPAGAAPGKSSPGRSAAAGRPAAPGVAPASPEIAETAARPIRVRPQEGGPAHPGSARPSPARGGGTPPASRTDPRVSATRAIPLTSATSRPGPTGRTGAPTRRGGPGGPGGPERPIRPPRPGSSRGPAPTSVYRRRRLVLALLTVLVLALAWPVGLLLWANGKVQHVDALSTAAGTPSTTYLIAGSDSRADGAVGGSDVTGARTDTVMLLTKPSSGTPSLISIPRDVPVEVPGHGLAKLNAAYAYGGPQALVVAVEDLTEITVDHYVEIGMLGVETVVDAVGGINLCWDAEVNDPESGMVWSPGCRDVDGAEALAFARMRKQDPTGDIGRGLRQQMVVQAVVGKLRGPGLLLPTTQVRLIDAATDSLVTDPSTGIVDLGQMALTFRAATGPNGFRGVPPISDPDYRGDGLGSTVLLDPQEAPVFWQQVMDGTLTPAKDAG